MLNYASLTTVELYTVLGKVVAKVSETNFDVYSAFLGMPSQGVI